MKTSVITGISSGLGLNLTRKPLARGDRIAASARRIVPVEALAAAQGDRLHLALFDGLWGRPRRRFSTFKLAFIGVALAAMTLVPNSVNGAASAAVGRYAPPPPNQGRNPMSEPNLSANDPSLSHRARELVRIGEEGIAKEDQRALEAFFHPDFRFHGPDGGALNREQLWAYFEACRAAFDDFTVTRQQIFSDGGANVAARTTFSGVFVRPFTASPIGTIQPNGQRVSYRINNVFRYAPDGRLIEEWAQYDRSLFLEKLGVKLIPAR
jgi:predicted ester cyclase